MENNKNISTKTPKEPTEKKSNKNNIVILFLGAFLIALVSFSAGVKVGLVKAKFSYRWGENYERNFVGGRSMGQDDNMRGPREFFHKFDRNDFRNAHGLAGTIISISSDNLIIKDRDGKENTVTVSEKTVLKKMGTDLNLSDLKASDKIVVLGRPGEKGTIEADLIRVFDNNQE